MSLLKFNKVKVASNQIKRVLVQPNIAFKRFGSTESDSKQETYAEESFHSVWWKRSLYAIVGLYAWSKFDATFFKEGYHPITRWIEFHQESEEESKVKQVVLLKNAQERARIRLMELEPEKLGFKRICTPDLFTRASQHGIVPGTQVDLSNMVIKY